MSHSSSRTKKTPKKGTRGVPRKDPFFNNTIPRGLPFPVGQKATETIKTYGYYRDSGTSAVLSTIIKTNTLLHSFGTAAHTTSRLSSLGRLFSKYRVRGYTLHVTVISKSTSQYMCGTYHTANVTNAPTAGTSWFIQDFPGSIHSQSHILAANTKSPCVVKWSNRYGLMSIIGSPEFKVDDSYVGALTSAGVASDPTDLTYCYLWGALLTGGTQTSGEMPDYYLELLQEVEFFDPHLP